MLKTATTVILCTLLLTPAVTFAAPQNFGELVYLFLTLINTAISIVVALAALGFFWGLSKYIFSAQDSGKVEEGRKIMIWGIVALFVIASIWGILRILSATFLDSGGGSAPQERIQYTTEV